MASPPDMTPEFLAYDEGPHIVRISIAMGLLAALFVVLRLWARKHTNIKHGIDDWLAISSLLTIYGFIIVGIIAVYRGGFGKHLAVNLMMDSDILSKALLYLFIGELIYITSIGLLKASILSMYCRIFPTRSVKLGGYILGVTVFLWCLSCTLVSLLQCQPIQTAWDPTKTSGTCIDKGTFFLGASIPNIITDAAILALPVREVWQLQVSIARKMAIAGIFLLGGFVVIVSCIRLYSLVDLLHGGKNSDLTQLIAGVWWWSVVELSIGCVSACLPTLLPLVRLVFRSFRMLSNSHSTGSETVAKESSAVVTIGSAQSRQPQLTSVDEVGPYEGLNGEGASTKDILPKGDSNVTSSDIFGKRDPSSGGEEIPMGPVTAMRHMC